MGKGNMNSKDSSLLAADLNKIPPNPKHIHLMGICGTGMASLAGILKQQGYHITGSDENVYPPMSLFLDELAIPVFKGYISENLDSGPDLVIVGNVIRKTNPEAIQLSRLHIPYLSMPQALSFFAMEGKKSIVIAGTHGKTTTSAIIAWVLEKAGMDPGFMIGGILNNFQRNFNLGKGPYFVIEGDEYDSAFFDKGPKFLHYRPFMTILTSIEFDHADIFRDLDHVKESFRRLIDIIPPGGVLIANGDDPVVTAGLSRARCPVITYGLKEGAEWWGRDALIEKDVTRFRIFRGNREYTNLSTYLYGDHNISNILAAFALLRYLKIDPSTISKAMREFRGVRRRQEIKGEKKGILILDDFAHHPTAVEKTIKGVKHRFKDRRLIAVFEPRSNSSRRNIFQERYSESFDFADLIFIPEPPMMDKVPPGERFSSPGLVKSLEKRGLHALYCPDTHHLIEAVIRESRKGDVILIMSNGSFDNLHTRLLEKL
jgi:UDP-N-acetylmuramate: L-alanyl-gamma-D-glutamyl-meso-diaminopimelate ligase